MILIFGGTTGGLGKELYRIMAGDNVFGVGRIHCDLKSEESISRYMSQIGKYDGLLHIINVTGISISSMVHKADQFDIMKTLRVNLVSNILLLKHARELYKKSGGTFTMVSSVVASNGPVGTSVYAASKSALNGFCQVAAKEFARLNTRINVIELGYCNTGMISQIADQQELIARISLGRLGTASDLAEACRFVIQCGYVTGSVIKVTGGL